MGRPVIRRVAGAGDASAAEYRSAKVAVPETRRENGAKRASAGARSSIRVSSISRRVASSSTGPSVRRSVGSP